MTVAELIKALQSMPQDAEVWHVWDGEARTRIRHVWESRDGGVITADDAQVLYSTGDRPKDAPTREQDRYWETPGDSGY